MIFFYVRCARNKNNQKLWLAVPTRSKKAEGPCDIARPMYDPVLGSLYAWEHINNVQAAELKFWKSVQPFWKGEPSKLKVFFENINCWFFLTTKIKFFGTPCWKKREWQWVPVSPLPGTFEILKFRPTVTVSHSFSCRKKSTFEALKGWNLWATAIYIAYIWEPINFGPSALVAWSQQVTLNRWQQLEYAAVCLGSDSVQCVSIRMWGGLLKKARGLEKEEKKKNCDSICFRPMI